MDRFYQNNLSNYHKCFIENNKSEVIYIKKVFVGTGLFILYIVSTFLVFIFQNKFSEKGFIFNDYTGKNVENFILTLIFLIVCLLFGFLLEIFKNKTLFYINALIWVTVFLAYIAIQRGENLGIMEMPIGILCFVFYPLMCGIAYIGIVDSFKQVDSLTFLFLGVLLPFTVTCFGYIIGKFARHRFPQRL